MDADEIFKRADFSVVLLFGAIIASFTRCSLFVASSALVSCRGNWYENMSWRECVA